MAKRQKPDPNMIVFVYDIMVCNSALLNLGEILKGFAFFGIFLKELQFHLYDTNNYLMLIVYISSKFEFRNLF